MHEKTNPAANMSPAYHAKRAAEILADPHARPGIVQLAQVHSLLALAGEVAIAAEALARLAKRETP